MVDRNKSNPDLISIPIHRLSLCNNYSPSASKTDSRNRTQPKITIIPPSLSHTLSLCLFVYIYSFHYVACQLQLLQPVFAYCLYSRRRRRRRRRRTLKTTAAAATTGLALAFSSLPCIHLSMEEETGRDPRCKPKSSTFMTVPPNNNHNHNHNHNGHNRRLPPGSLFGLGFVPRGPTPFPDWWYYYYYYYHHHRHLNPYPPSILPLPPPPPPPPPPSHLPHAPPPPPLLRRSQLHLVPRPVAPSSDGRIRDITAPPPSGKVEC